MKIPWLGIEIKSVWDNTSNKSNEPEKGLPVEIEDIKKTNIKVPTARSSEPPGIEGSWTSLDNDHELVEPGYQFEVIPIIRKLVLNNENVGQALSNYVALANTGHKITFDSSVKPDQVDKMRKHLKKVSKNWHYGSAGIHGIANKMFTQALISGAVSAELIPTLRLDGLSRITFPLPESIRFVYNKRYERYEPYQKVTTLKVNEDNLMGLKKLNVNTFKYVAISGDTESPYPNPPYLPVLTSVADQKVMRQNIQFIIRQMGIMGFLELLVEKPVQTPGTSDQQYERELEAYLDKCKRSIVSSMRDGVMVGYQEDHEFQFHTASASASGVAELYNQNEATMFSGLKQDPALSGRSTGSTETHITIVFTKLLSELANIQLAVAHVLEQACELELRLAGFKFNTLEIEFKASTIQDDLKLQQAQEIKIRNLRQLRMDGIISQDQYADALNIEKPYKQEPVVPFAPAKSTGDPNLDAEKKAVREKSKDASDRRVRDKNKPQGTR